MLLQCCKPSTVNSHNHLGHSVWFSLIHISIRTQPLCIASWHLSVIFSVAAILGSLCLKYIPPLFLEKVMHHSHVIGIIGIQERQWVDHDVWTELQGKSFWPFTHLMSWLFTLPATPTSFLQRPEPVYMVTNGYKGCPVCWDSVWLLHSNVFVPFKY